MVTQRLTMATFAGASAVAVAALVRSWQTASDPAAVDRFCAVLREHAQSLPIVYFCEWLDRWLMGDRVPGPEAVEGRRYQATCLSPEQALAWADRGAGQFPEEEWLASRLREAARGGFGTEPRAVVIVREVLDVSATDKEVMDHRVPVFWQDVLEGRRTSGG
jgi:hypothetical protein